MVHELLHIYSSLGVKSQRKDTVDDQKPKVPEQQDSEDEGRLAHDVPRGFLLPNTPAAPGGRHSQSGRSRETGQCELQHPTHSLTATKKNPSVTMTDSLWKSTVAGLA